MDIRLGDWVLNLFDVPAEMVDYNTANLRTHIMWSSICMVQSAAEQIKQILCGLNSLWTIWNTDNDQLDVLLISHCLAGFAPHISQSQSCLFLHAYTPTRLNQIGPSVLLSWEAVAGIQLVAFRWTLTAHSIMLMCWRMWGGWQRGAALIVFTSHIADVKFVIRPWK